MCKFLNFGSSNFRTSPILFRYVTFYHTVMKQKSELIESLLNEAQKLSYKDGNLDKVQKRAEMLVKKVFGEKTEYVQKLNSISYSPYVVTSGMDRSVYQRSFSSGKDELINLINTMLEDLSLTDLLVQTNENLNSQKTLSENIFIVHGHNEEMKQSLARFIEKINYNPIILHEQPNKGRTIIEKFSDYSDVSFAIILLSGDDIAYNKNDKADNAKLRARQNVILELGFFLGKIGRENVVVIHEDINEIEIPSDYAGILYVPYDKNGNWKLSIAKELKAVGYKIDGNKLLE